MRLKLVGSNPLCVIQMVEKLEDMDEIDGHGIDMSEFNEEYRSKDYQKPIGHMPMLRGYFQEGYDP